MSKKTEPSSRRKKKIRMKRRLRAALAVFVLLLIIIAVTIGIVSCVNKNKKENDDTTLSSQQDQQTQTEPEPEAGDTEKQPVQEGEENNKEENDKNDGQPTADPNAPEPEPEQPDEEDTPTSWDTSYDISDIKPVGEISKDAWNLVLANPDHALPEGYQKTLTLANFSNTYKVDARMLPYLQKMFAAAKADGITLVLRSAFRTNERQWELYNGRVKEYINKGYSEEEAAKIAATINAYPGTSEHETGLAVDILSQNFTSFNSNFDKTNEYKWLENNAYKFGFILRYPQDKLDIHKIIYEPWHYRFVGIENSYPIHEQGICLEEYLETLN